MIFILISAEKMFRGSYEGGVEHEHIYIYISLTIGTQYLYSVNSKVRPAEVAFVVLY